VIADKRRRLIIVALASIVGWLARGAPGQGASQARGRRAPCARVLRAISPDDQAAGRLEI